MSLPRSVLFLHRALALSGGTERLRRGAERLCAQGVRVTVLAGPGARADEVAACSAALAPGEERTAGWRGLFAAARARRLAAQVGAELAHVTGTALAPLAARLGRPYLLELEGPVRARVPWSREHLRRVILPCATLVEGAVNRGGLPRDRIAVLPHAADLGPRPASPFARPGRPRVGCGGYLVPELGGGVFLEAVRRLLVRGVRARFLVFGEGPDGMALRRRARELAIETELVIAAPAAPPVAELLTQLDVFVSARTDGVPGWFAHQALALGLPSVLAANGGAFALVEDGADGLLVERGDPTKLADAIAGLLADPPRARLLGAAARLRYASRSEEPEYGDALLGLCAEALGDPVSA